MIRIMNQEGRTLAVLKEVIDPLITEKINSEFTFTFSAEIEKEKAAYINGDNMIDVNGSYFDIAFYNKYHNDTGVFVDVECEHVSYRLNNENVEYFGHYGTPSEILSEILSGTDLTVGEIDFQNEQIFGIEEEMTKKSLLKAFVNQLNGELDYDGYAISILTRRGSDEGKQFKVGKNIKGITEKIDVKGSKVSIEIDVVELSQVPGYGSIESINLGDTRHILADKINLETEARVVSYAYNPLKKRNSTVEIANFIEDISDSITSVKSTQLRKDKLYNGIRVGPTEGFLSERSDGLVRTRTSATEGFNIQSRSSESDSWVDRLKVKTNGQLELNTEQIDGIKASITVLNNEIELKVSEEDYNGDEIVSRINLSSDLAVIEAENINLVGAVTVLSDITGELGTITAGTINGVQINSANIEIDEDAKVGNNLYIGSLGSSSVKRLFFNDGVNISGNQFAQLNFSANDYNFNNFTDYNFNGVSFSVVRFDVGEIDFQNSTISNFNVPSHTHSAGNITSGTFAEARIPKTMDDYVKNTFPDDRDLRISVSGDRLIIRDGNTITHRIDMDPA